MDFISCTITAIFALIAISVSSDCPDAVESAVDDYMEWYEYAISEVALSKGRCVKETITKLDDTTLSIINVQVDESGDIVTKNWTATLEGKRLIVKDGTEVLVILNTLIKKQDFIIYGVCRDTQNLVSLTVWVNEKQPDEEVVDKINEALATITKKPRLNLVDQYC